MRFGVLGPVSVHDGNHPVVIGAAKERALLAILLARANQQVPAERLIEELWGGSPPRSASKTLQTYVLHLRRFLGNRLLTEHGGYRLHVLAGELDRAVFEETVAEGRLELLRGDAHGASRILGEAVELWRGEPYAGVDPAGSVQVEAVRLGELRLEALEDWMEARLAAGAHRELVPELETLVASHPLRESLWALLMQALYRSGRQGDALRVFQRARAHLVDELGVEPGPELRAVESAILGHRLVAFAPAYQAPPPQYVRNPDGLQIAYWTMGDGPRDVVFLGDIYMHLELLWEFSSFAPFLDRIGEGARLIAVQRRGTGLSDRDPHTALAPPQACVHDVDTVLDALASSHAAIVAWGHGAQVALVYASARPERVDRAALVNAFARLGAAHDYPEGMPEGLLERWLEAVGAKWGKSEPAPQLFGPAGNDPAFITRLARIERLTATSGDAVAMHRALNEFDVRDVLDHVRCPVLVVHSIGSVTPRSAAVHLATHLPSARFVELAGHFIPTAEDALRLGSEVAQFLGSPP